MGQQTKIEWTDHTFNPWRGCEHRQLADGSTHPGCEHCYAESMAKRFPERLGKWGAAGTRIMAPEKLWRQPLAWNKAAGKAGKRARVFCASIADVFEDWHGPIHDPAGTRLAISQDGTIGPDGGGGWLRMQDLRKKLFALIDQTPWLDWQLLTKRPGNIAKMTPPYAYHACETGDCPHNYQSECDNEHERKYRDNAWFGTSISNQQTADELIPQLLQARELAGQLFLSAEPLLGPVDLRKAWRCRDCGGYDAGGVRPHCSGCQRISEFPNWLIVGGESGQQARPMHPDWARSLRDQCQDAGVAFFFKQWGEWQNGSHINGKLACVLNDGRYAYPDGQEARQKLYRETAYDWGRFAATSMAKVGKAEAGRLLDGRKWNEFPAVNHEGSKAPREEEPV